jgi:hypothetical protein
MKLDKKQLSLLKLFKIQNRICIEIQGSSQVWNSKEFDWICLESSRIATIWTRIPLLHLDDISTHERSLEIQILEFLNFLQGFKLNLILISFGLLRNWFTLGIDAWLRR